MHSQRGLHVPDSLDTNLHTRHCENGMEGVQTLVRPDVQVSEVVVGRSLSEIYMVMEYVEHDLKQLSESMKQPFSIAEVRP